MLVLAIVNRDGFVTTKDVYVSLNKGGNPTVSSASKRCSCRLPPLAPTTEKDDTTPVGDDDDDGSRRVMRELLHSGKKVQYVGHDAKQVQGRGGQYLSLNMSLGDGR
jgi:hypothetical protein